MMLLLLIIFLIQRLKDYCHKLSKTLTYFPPKHLQHLNSPSHERIAACQQKPLLCDQTDKPTFFSQTHSPPTRIKKILPPPPPPPKKKTQKKAQNGFEFSIWQHTRSNPVTTNPAFTAPISRHSNETIRKATVITPTLSNPNSS